MPLADFTSPDRKWIIKFSDSKTCLETKQVTFSGLEDQVSIDCGGDVPFPIGKYNKGTNCIDLGDYEIRLQLVYAPKIPTPIGGSWTAEDTAGGVGGDGEKGD